MKTDYESVNKIICCSTKPIDYGVSQYSYEWIGSYYSYIILEVREFDGEKWVKILKIDDMNYLMGCVVKGKWTKNHVKNLDMKQMNPNYLW